MLILTSLLLGFLVLLITDALLASGKTQPTANMQANNKAAPKACTVGDVQ